MQDKSIQSEVAMQSGAHIHLMPHEDGCLGMSYSYEILWVLLTLGNC